jgi:hypothetical protein
MSISHKNQGKERILKCVHNLHFRTLVSSSLWNITKGYNARQEVDTLYTLWFISSEDYICYTFQVYNTSMASVKRAGIAQSVQQTRYELDGSGIES